MTKEDAKRLLDRRTEEEKLMLLQFLEDMKGGSGKRNERKNDYRGKFTCFY